MAFQIPNEDAALVQDQAEPDSVDINILVQGFARTGVISGGAATQQSVPDVTVQVSACTFELNGQRYTVSGGNSPAMPSDPSNPRFYLLCASTSGSFVAAAGNAQSQPEFPAVPSNSVVLHAIYMPSGSGTIVANQIVDKRVFLSTQPVFDKAGIGTGTATPNAGKLLDVLGTKTTVDGSAIRPISITGTQTYSTTAGGDFAAYEVNMTLANAVSVALARGVANTMLYSGTAPITEINAVYAQTLSAFSSAPTIPLWRGLYVRHTRFGPDTATTTQATAIEGEIAGSGGTVTTAVGLKLTNLNGSTVWGLQIGNYQSYHQGPVLIGNNTSPNVAAILELQSTTRGLLPPKMTTTQRNAVTSPPTGLEVINTTTGTPDYYNGSAWQSMVAVKGDGTPAAPVIVDSAVPTLTPVTGQIWIDTSERHFDMTTLPNMTEYPVSPTANTYTRSIVHPNSVPSANAVSNPVLQMALATGSTGSDRRLISFDDVIDLDDSEITSLWINRRAHFVQPGHFHRLQNTGTANQIAVVVYMDALFGLDNVINLGLWKGNTGLTQIQNNNIIFDNIGGMQGSLSAVFCMRNVGTAITTGEHGLLVNNLVRLEASNSAFTGTWRITSVPSSTSFSFAMAHSDIAYTADTGQFHYSQPLWVTSRLIGATLYLKAWPQFAPEPSWSDPSAVFVQTFTDPATPVGTGKQGLVQSHIGDTSGETMQYGPTTISRPNRGGARFWNGSSWVSTRGSYT